MPSILALPTELRHQILLNVLPTSIDTSPPLPSQLLALLTINHRLSLDTLRVIPTWSPTHILTHAQAPRTLSIHHANKTYTPKRDTITLDIFATSDADRIQSTCYCQGPETYSHPEIVAAWQSNVPDLLHDNIKKVLLDVTPAPTSYRTAHRLKLNHFLGQKWASRTFLWCHVSDIAQLVLTIHAHFPDIDIALTGALSVKAKPFVENLVLQSGVEDLEFVGRWVSTAEAKKSKITTAVHDIVSKQQVKQATRKGEVHTLKWLREVVWAQGTMWSWATFADDGCEEDARGDLRRLVDFAEREEIEMSMGCFGSVRRVLQHRIAQDMGFVTWSEGLESERCVFVGRKGNGKAARYQRERERKLIARKGKHLYLGCE